MTKIEEPQTVVIDEESTQGYPIAISGNPEWPWEVGYNGGDVIVKHYLRMQAEARELAAAISTKLTRTITAMHNRKVVDCECYRFGSCDDKHSKESTNRFAVVDGYGWAKNQTKVYSAHPTIEAALAAKAKRKSLMVIWANAGFQEGETVYLVNIPQLYPVVG